MQRLHNGNKLAHINSTLAYGYDANGNMNTDHRKDVNVVYNLLNLPHKVSENSTVKATYKYVADGTKASAIATNVILIPNIIMQINGFMYFGSMVYKIEDNNFGLESTSFGGGRINATSNDYEIDYFITDHLGSTRVIVDNAGNIKEQNDYYPFGMRHENSLLMVSTNRWEFGGKEKQTLDNMGWLDFMARMLSNCEIPMFTTQDPSQENYYNWTQYNYCFYNPAKYIDPDGKDARIIITDNTVTIRANIILYSKQIGIGRDKLNQVAAKYKQDIIDKWSKDSDGNNWTYQQNGKTYTVKFEVDVTVNTMAAHERNRNYNGENNYIEVINGDDMTVLSKVTGSRDGTWTARTQGAAHEFGHIVGLKDRYTNVDREDGRKRSVPHDGWNGNIMSSINGNVEQRNINAVINDAFIKKTEIPFSRLIPIFVYTRTRHNKED